MMHHGMAKDGHHRTISAKHGSEHTHTATHPFHKGGALKKSGHHGLIGDGKGHGMKAHKGVHSAMKGHFIATPSNVGKLGHKAK